MNVGGGWEAASHRLFARSRDDRGVPIVPSIVKGLLHYTARVSKAAERKAIIAALAALLKAERERKPLSLQKAGAAAGVDRTMWARFEKNERGVGLEVLLMMADALDLNLGRLLVRAIRKVRG